MLSLLIALVGATIAAPLLLRTIGRVAFALIALVPLAGFIWIASLFHGGVFADGGAVMASYQWMPSTNLNLDFRLDALSGLFSLIILGCGSLVLFYCWGYFDSNPRRLATFGAQLTMFAMVMYGLVISDNFLLMYTFWELTSVLSYLLVAYYGERASSRRSAIQALMVTTFGGLAMLVGIILFGQQTGIWKLSDIATFGGVAETPGIAAAIILVMLGALTKSAQAPFHFWLPGAMAAPTPVSAYLHSAAMVKAGIYLVARLAPDFAAVPTWHIVVCGTGIFTMLLGGWMALKQKDLKLILAYGTVSQLGFITAVIGIGSREATMAGLALTFGHSLFKAALFMIVGAIDHTTGTRDIRELSGLGKKEPLLAVLAIISAASMAGIPPLFGFVAKETALDAVLHEELLHGMPGKMLLVGLVAGSILTMAYSLYFIHGAFATKRGATTEEVAQMDSIGPTLWLSPAILTALTVAFGLFPGWMSRAFNEYLDVRFPEVEGNYLALWHGFTIPLLLTGVIIGAGALMFWQRDVVAKAQFERPALGDADDVWDNIIRTLRIASLRLTASTQRGSLTINLATIFLVLMVVPLAGLILGPSTDIRMIVWDSPWQGMTVVFMSIIAVAATLQRNRLSGVVMVGLTGFSLALIFALHGAPDLALTQVLVETIVMVVFMLVLRKMPTDLESRSDSDVRLRAWLSIGTGLSVVIVAMTAISSRIAEPISGPMPDLAYEIGHGRNAVNVLLVDLRAFDTFGEITVLAIAATGVASLIFGTGSFYRDSRRPVLSSSVPRWLSSSVNSETAQNRHMMVEAATRILFPSMMLLAAYFFFSGHNAPGGGFAGGLVAALAFALRYLAGGRDEIEEALPVNPEAILGTGLLLSAAAAVAPMFFGYPPLTSGYIEPDLPLIGQVAIPSALLFDAGVSVIVVGLIMHILTSVGAHLDKEEDARKERARERARAMQEKNEQRRALQASKRRERASASTSETGETGRSE
ncbi:multisubunit sodium/proton antiporter, MrpA subunit /multisubunit sodium/proton antiporter, MrpB subunit [Corynebacterium mycetoides]|uniref:Multisubunit sodium/proton antiporter, MrpA subunit /multisubunit sodium/proton antiporter, MrpB subunit n=1 Tax=Corynebacterium mycetoides TaxID=38302 RepID=A0A1G9P650_9CORY|nr:Na+/H+ antiporter subunit A [Corynebacterium mycetoides]SDL94210.1 multisubunit sodium/proton antiporter, MrpA subunit /multisubunit sodium/proton antiporter, MrpB subunit [Corynebacterium mycetoides]